MQLSQSTKVMRATRREDLTEVMRIIDEARRAINELGIIQWTDSYPALKHIIRDIDAESSYVLLDEHQKIVGTAAVSFGEEPCYAHIEEGAWKYEGPYATVHRVAVDPKLRGRGLAAFLFAGAEALAVARKIKIVRIDTHEWNLPMRRALEKDGYEYSGVVHLESGAKRVAYEKLIP